MIPLLKAFLDIILARRGPQHLPDSALLLGLSTLFYVLVSAIQLTTFGESGPAWWVFLCLDPLLLMLTTFLLLRLHGHPERFRQTAAAVLGTGALLGLAVFLPLQLAINAAGGGPDSGLARLTAVVSLALFAVVTGRIFKLGAGISLVAGMAVAIAYFFVINLLLGMLAGGSH